MPIPLYCSLQAKIANTLWFNIDKSCDDENELMLLEQEQASWISAIVQGNSDAHPIGKTQLDHLEEVEEDDDEEDDNDDDTDSHDDEDDEDLDMEVSYDRDSPVDISIRLGSGASHGASVR